MSISKIWAASNSCSAIEATSFDISTSGAGVLTRPIRCILRCSSCSAGRSARMKMRTIRISHRFCPCWRKAWRRGFPPSHHRHLSWLAVDRASVQLISSGKMELGWTPLRLIEAGRASALRHLDAVPVFHWHAIPSICRKARRCLHRPMRARIRLSRGASMYSRCNAIRKCWRIASRAGWSRIPAIFAQRHDGARLARGNRTAWPGARTRGTRNVR